MHGICNSNLRRLDASIIRGRVSIEVMGICIVYDEMLGSIGRWCRHDWIFTCCNGCDVGDIFLEPDDFGEV